MNDIDALRLDNQLFCNRFKIGVCSSGGIAVILLHEDTPKAFCVFDSVDAMQSAISADVEAFTEIEQLIESGLVSDHNNTN